MIEDGARKVLFFTVLPSPCACPCDFVVAKNHMSNPPGLTVCRPAYETPCQLPRGFTEPRPLSKWLCFHQLTWQGWGSLDVCAWAKYSLRQARHFIVKLLTLSRRKMPVCQKQLFWVGKHWCWESFMGRVLFWVRDGLLAPYRICSSYMK